MANRRSTTEPQPLSERYARWVLPHRWAVLLTALLLTAASAAGLPMLDLATDYRVFFSPDNPDLAAYEAVENIYTKNDNVLFVLQPASGDVFTPELLDTMRSLTTDAWQIPYSTRVDGLTNFQHTWADGDELIVEDLVGPGPITPEVVARARQVGLSEPMLVGKLVAPDARTAGINVRVSLPGESKAELPATVEHVRELLTTYRAAHPDLEIHASGIAMMNWSFAEAPMLDMPFVMPLMFGALVLAIVFFLRSMSGIVGTLTVLLLSTLTAVGIAGHLGLLLDPVSAAAPIVILTLAVADSIHILVTWMALRRDNIESREALVEALRINAMPVFLTSITTAIGFLSLNFSDSPPFKLLGNITAFGVMVAWVYSMSVLPALVEILPAGAVVRRGSGRLDALMERFADFIVRRHRPVLAAATAVAILLSLSIAKLKVNDQYIDYFAESLPIRVASDFTVDNLSGIYSTSYSLEAGGSQEVANPAYLAAVDAFSDYLVSRPGVVHVNSFTRTMKRLNMNLHADDPAEYRLPDDQELAAQYLLLYELSLPYGLDVNDQIDVDKRALRLDVTYGDVDIAEVEEEIALAGAWLAANGTESMRSAQATGVPRMFGKITRRNVSSMLVGTGLGFLLIAAILMFALRSLRLGIISLIPNVLPAAVAFGIWAWLVGDVGFAVSVVTGLSIGIIVDDTVHFLSKYNLARQEKGLAAPDAVRYAFRTVGVAILGTTFIVAIGFAMLGLSTFRVTSYMGQLTSLTVLSALAIDFLLLPTLLIAFDRGGTTERVPESPERSTSMPHPPRTATTSAALVLAALLIPAVAAAQAPDVLRGREIAEEADSRDRGWGDNASSMRMVLHNRNGDESTRELRRRVLEVTEPGAGDRSLITFDAPRDVAGTALLSHTKILDPDDQWLFLPALKRVKRISSANKSGPFVGSEFAYEDLVSQELDKYDYRFEAEEACGTLTCYRVERTPRYENSGYTKQVVWWDTAEYRVQRIDFYDRKDSLLKTLAYDGYQQYLENFWRADLMTMTNHQNGKSTDLVFADWSFANGFEEGEFTPSRLRQAR